MTYAHPDHGNHLGKITFVTTGNKDAQTHFVKGVAWLHSFEYQEARNDFQMAEKLDPGFAMAYWGEAMTYNHPLWQEQDKDSAIKALQKLACSPEERIKKAETPIEKGFINAINLLYGTGNKKNRDIQYADAMRTLYLNYPDNDEVAIFYALALFGTTEGNRDFGTYMQAAGIAEDIYQHNSEHPGAMHYLIHAYDDPIHAPLGLRAARAYAKMAPDASHALHMPSHIFFALGMWNDVIKSNKAAWEAGLKNNKTNNPGLFTIDDLHALHWLTYAYLQQKCYKTALLLTKQMEKIALGSNSPMAKWYYSMMRTAYISESHDWKADLKSVNLKNIELSAKASDAYINALIALNTKPLVQGIESIKTMIKQLSLSIPRKSTIKDSYPNYFMAITSSGIDATKITILELKALVMRCKGKTKQAIEVLRTATKLEDNISFGYGPPIPVKPAYEILADFLLQDKQYLSAYNAYSYAAKRTPNRRHLVEEIKTTLNKLNELKITLPKIPKPYFNKLMQPDFYQ